MGLCQQKQYTQIDYSKKAKNGLDFQPIFKQPFPKTKDELRFEESIKKMQEKKRLEDQKFSESIKKMEEKKRLEDQKFSESINKIAFLNQKRTLKPNQTQMAKVLYAYMRHYGRNPSYGDEIKNFIQQNYNDKYCSYVYKLGSSTPITTYKSQVIDRLKTAHQNCMISDHQVFTKADEVNRKIQYTWTVRQQLKNYRTLYNCEAEFDDKNRFLRLTMHQTDTYNYKPPLPAEVKPEVKAKHSWETSSNNYYAPSTDWGAYYNAQTQRSNQQFRQNMNKQAQEWNDYARQKNARGW